MIYSSKAQWLGANQKRILLFGMSGLGKTFIANTLRQTGNWFHYSVDYRIGTRYMGEHIADNFKAEAMKNPFLAELLRTDSIYVGSNITFDNLAPLSTYLGKPGDPEKGGIPFDEYLRRQELHRAAEVASLRDAVPFIDRSTKLYGYDHYICDTSGSICEVVDPYDKGDRVMAEIADNLLVIWIEGSEDHTAELSRRFDKSPKPMYYQKEFLVQAWEDYLAETGDAPTKVDPNAFVRWTYSKALAHRAPRYRAIAENWGITLKAADVWKVNSAEDFEGLVAQTLASR